MLKIGKIPRIQREPLSKDEASAALSTKASLLSSRLPRADYFNIYKNMTVLFIGDQSMRTMYRDLCHMFKFDRMLDYTDAKRSDGDYKLLQDEEIIFKTGQKGTDLYYDIKQFYLKEKNIKLIHVHLSTLFNDRGPKNLEFIKRINQQSQIDVILFTSYSNDVTECKIGRSNLTLNDYFTSYLAVFDQFANYLRQFCNTVDKKQQLYFWLSPLPKPFDKSSIKESQFENLLDQSRDIVKKHNYIEFDRYDIWKRRKDLTIPDNGYISLHGYREMTDSFARCLARKLNRPFTSAIPSWKSPVNCFNSLESNNKQSNQSASKALPKYNRHHPYAR
ncbi:unnamed protein product [Adineta ricciae]|uniref:Uncharacterized protein n=1 Tax=Adineta ricciae TaxID=249248 RepID=A0A815T256_ADIRI|nr:unnamed protein product [Adineta ricciae]CAF1498634.1 unnamed protein product [Adineta ricciae]